MPASRAEALDLIQKHIDEFGHHIYTVLASVVPRFHYTIGLFARFEFELIFAGGVLYTSAEVQRIINKIVDNINSHGLDPTRNYNVPLLGTFEVGPVHASWARELMIGAQDFYNPSFVPASQIIPDKSHLTIDVPDLSQPWSSVSEPIWQWLREPWLLPVPATSSAITNIAALQGARVTEAARWGADEWELFASPESDLDIDDVRIVPLGTLLATDASLEPIASLPVGKALRRDLKGGWREWHSS